MFERNWAFPQKQRNCARFVASKLRVGNLRRLINSSWFQLGRAVVSRCAAPQRHAVVKTKHNTDVVGFSLLFQIYRATAAFTSTSKSTLAYTLVAMAAHTLTHTQQPATYSFFTTKAHRHAYSVQIQYMKIYPELTVDHGQWF